MLQQWVNDLKKSYKKCRQNGFLRKTLGWTASGFALMAAGALLSSFCLAWMQPYLMILLIIFSVIALVAAIVLTFATEKKTVTTAYYTMAMAIGFTTMPLIDDVMQFPHGGLLVLTALLGTALIFTGAWLYAYKNQDDPSLLGMAGSGLLLGLLFMPLCFYLLQIPAAMMLYSAIAIVVFSLYLACDLAWAITIGKDGYYGDDDVLPIKMGATIFLDLVNIFKDMLLLIVAIRSGRSTEGNSFASLLKFLGVIAMVVVLPIALIWYCVNRDTDSSVDAQGSASRQLRSQDFGESAGDDARAVPPAGANPKVVPGAEFRAGAVAGAIG